MKAVSIVANREIPRREWESFFPELSLHYDGWRAAVEVVGHEVFDDAPAEHTLDSIVAELDDGDDLVTIEFTDASSIDIERPSRVLLEETEDGADDILEIESPNGTVRLRLQFPMQQETEDLE